MWFCYLNPAGRVKRQLANSEVVTEGGCGVGWLVGWFSSSLLYLFFPLSLHSIFEPVHMLGFCLMRRELYVAKIQGSYTRAGQLASD